MPFKHLGIDFPHPLIHRSQKFIFAHSPVGVNCAVHDSPFTFHGLWTVSDTVKLKTIEFAIFPKETIESYLLRQTPKPKSIFLLIFANMEP